MSTLATVLQSLAFVRDGGSVKRMHTVRTAHTQNVAEHSYGVAWLVWELSNRQPSANLLMAALAHDVPEVEVGDIPSPTKRALNSRALHTLEASAMADNFIPVFELTEHESLVLKVADMLDLAMYCVDEHNLGNREPRLDAMFSNVMSYLTFDMLNETGLLAVQLHNWLNIDWRMAK